MICKQFHDQSERYGIFPWIGNIPYAYFFAYMWAQDEIHLINKISLYWKVLNLIFAVVFEVPLFFYNRRDLLTRSPGIKKV